MTVLSTEWAPDRRRGLGSRSAEAHSVIQSALSRRHVAIRKRVVWRAWRLLERKCAAQGQIGFKQTCLPLKTTWCPDMLG